MTPGDTLALTDELEQLRSTARKIAEAELSPYVEAAEREQRLPREVFTILGRSDLLSLTHEVGGSTVPWKMAEVLLVEELGRVCAGFATSVIVQLSVVPGLLRAFGGDGLADRWLPGMATGELVGSLAATEPDAGSDIKGMKARAVPVRGGYEISGSKVFITNGTLADFYLVAAVVDPDRGREGIGIFVVERDNPGVVAVEKMEKTAVRSSDTAALRFEGCKVGDDAVLGGDLDGFAKLMSTFDGERVVHAARALGLAQAAFEASDRYADQRVQFGQPIRRFQAVAFKLADMVVAIEASRLLVYRAAQLSDEGHPFHREASIAKLFATEAARTIATEAMQVHGSYGLTAEFPLGRYVADSHLETIGTGTSEIQRLIIARTLGRR